MSSVRSNCPDGRSGNIAVFHYLIVAFNQSSLGGLFRPMALREAPAPPQGRPCDMICTCNLVQPLGLWCPPPFPTPAFPARHLFPYPPHSLALPPTCSSPLPPSPPAPPPPRRLAVCSCFITSPP